VRVSLLLGCRRLGTYFLTIKKDIRKAEKDGIARRGAYCILLDCKGSEFKTFGWGALLIIQSM